MDGVCSTHGKHENYIEFGQIIQREELTGVFRSDGMVIITEWIIKIWDIKRGLIHLAPGKDQWWAPVNLLMNFRNQ
jgi:hypothetical protein